MITKFLIVGKQVLLQSKAPTTHEDVGTIIELLMPLDQYWKLEDTLKMSTFMQASGETASDVMATMRTAFGICARYAVNEKDREWLHARITESQ